MSSLVLQPRIAVRVIGKMR